MTESDEAGRQEGHAEAVRVPRRLKRRPIEMKRWMVEETFAPGASVAGVARRYGVNANQGFFAYPREKYHSRIRRLE